MMILLMNYGRYREDYKLFGYIYHLPQYSNPQETDQYYLTKDLLKNQIPY